MFVFAGTARWTVGVITVIQRVVCNRYRMTEAQIALAARYGVETPFPPDHTIPPPEPMRLPARYSSMAPFA